MMQKQVKLFRTRLPWQGSYYVLIIIIIIIIIYNICKAYHSQINVL